MELFISDLDGTLLNSNQQISEYSKEQLNKLIDQGVNFSIATARTPATVVDIVDGLKLKIPVVMMNGVMIYDVEKKKYIDIKSVDKNIAENVLDIFKKHNKDCFLYGIKDNHLWVHHKDFTCNMEETFYIERCNKPLKSFKKVDDYYNVIQECDVINFIIFGELEKVKAVYDELNQIKGLTVDYYKDIYGDGYFLDAYSSEASKANGIKHLSDYIKYNKIISFGDNVNDIPMFNISDECYATENAVDKLKELATEVIESNNDDGVAKFIAKRFDK